MGSFSKGGNTRTRGATRGLQIVNGDADKPLVPIPKLWHAPIGPYATKFAGVVGSMMLLKTYQNLHAPLTQDAPLMTEDMHEERLRAVEALGDLFVSFFIMI